MPHENERARSSANADPERLDGLSALREAVLERAQKTRRDLAILSHELEPPLYDTPEFSEAVSQLARSGRHARVRLLIREHDHLVKQGHHLVRLAQKLPSYVEIRRIAPEYRQALNGFMVADRESVVYQPQTDTYEAQASHHAPRWARDLLTDFQRLWDHAVPDAELRRLSLDS